MPDSQIQFTAKLIEAFSGMYLSHLYDAASGTPEFHRKAWELYCNATTENIAIAAPRKHAKTTSLTINFGLAAAVFRWQKFIVVLGASERLSNLNLLAIREELASNVDLRSHFGIKGFIKDTSDDIHLLSNSTNARVMVRANNTFNCKSVI